MTSSGTYSFAPSNGQLILSAFERIQLRTPSLRQEHMNSAYYELNYLMATFGNLQPNLWKVELNTVDLVQGTATYTLPARVVMVLDAYVAINAGSTNQTNRTITPISRSEFASYAQPQTQAPPTVFWFNRQITPTITTYPVADGNGPYVLYYYACVQMQDGNLAGGETPDIPYLWLDALVSGLAHRLARIYAPALEAVRRQDAKEAWEIAATQNVENVPLVLAPGLGSYYRRG